MHATLPLRPQLNGFTPSARDRFPLNAKSLDLTENKVSDYIFSRATERGLKENLV
ncbi:hypothetical protein ADE_43970 [Achromobacter denitrificans]|nr:hypothetical protein ADE_43970 [Achromobacter denitrificans]